MDRTKLLDCILELKRKCDFENSIAEAFRITVSEIQCLLRLDEEENICANSLCGKLGLSKSRGSRIIGGLSRKGFIEVRTDDRDKRFSCLALTRSGRLCIDAIRRERGKCENMLKARLHPEKYVNAKRTVRVLIELMQGEKYAEQRDQSR
jgi:DNA-binding MarR family transcriptional regulator